MDYRTIFPTLIYISGLIYWLLADLQCVIWIQQLHVFRLNDGIAEFVNVGFI